MTKLAFNKSMGKAGVVKLLLSIGMPVLFLVAFFCKQIISVDSIGWVNGFSHPLTGWDHLLTMLAVGIWAAQLRGQAIWMLPLAFVGVMSLGGIAGAAGVTVPSVEGIILLSCAVFSVLITRKVRFNAKINVMIVAFFAFFHGFAHGQEISASASLISYTLGFMLATLLLHGAGILVAKLVILTITCLIGVIFSTTAIAEMRASSLESDQAFSADVCRETFAAEFFDYRQRLNRSRHTEAYASMSVDKHDAIDIELESGRQKLKDLTASASDLHGSELRHVYFETANKQSSPACLGFALNPAQVFAGNYALLPKALLPGLFLSIGFSSLYPSINNTPGMLLSNGVGLNSPPASKSVVRSLKLSNHFRSTPVFFFEDIRLQSVFVPPSAGKTHVSQPHVFMSRDLVAWGQSRLEFLNPQSILEVRGHACKCLKSARLFRKNTLWPSGLTSILLLSESVTDKQVASDSIYLAVSRTTFNL